MSDYQKFFAVTVNLKKENAWLAEFILGKLATDNVELICNESLFPEEYPEYIEDSKNWIPIEKFIEDYGTMHHWSGIGKARTTQKVVNALLCDRDELVYIYNNGDFKRYEN